MFVPSGPALLVQGLGLEAAARQGSTAVGFVVQSLEDIVHLDFASESAGDKEKVTARMVEW